MVRKHPKDPFMAFGLDIRVEANHGPIIDQYRLYLPEDTAGKLRGAGRIALDLADENGVGDLIQHHPRRALDFLRRMVGDQSPHVRNEAGGWGMSDLEMEHYLPERPTIALVASVLGDRACRGLNTQEVFAGYLASGSLKNIRGHATLLEAFRTIHPE